MNTMDCDISQLPIVSRLKQICETWERVSQSEDAAARDSFVHALLRETIRLTLSSSWQTVEIGDRLTLRDILLQFDNWGCQTFAGLLPDPWQCDEFLKGIEKSLNSELNNDISHHCTAECMNTPREVFHCRLEILLYFKFRNAAVQLCLYYRRCTSLQKDLFYADKLFQLLFDADNYALIVQQMEYYSCHEGLKLIEFISINEGPSAQLLVDYLIKLLLVREFAYKSPYCCTQILINTWCSHRLEQGASIDEVIEDAGGLGVVAVTSAHIYLLIDILFKHYGRKNLSQLLPLYLKLYTHALTLDVNNLETAKHLNCRFSVAELETHMAAMYGKLASLMDSEEDLGIAYECLLTAFSLEPTIERLKELERRAPSKTVWRYNRTYVKPCQGECHCIETGSCRKDNELPPWYITEVPNGILDAKLPGVPYSLLQDLCVLVEGPRCRGLTWNTPTVELQQFCNNYMQSVRKLRVKYDDKSLGINCKLSRLDSLNVKLDHRVQVKERSHNIKNKKRTLEPTDNCTVLPLKNRHKVNRRVVEDASYPTLNQPKKPKKSILNLKPAAKLPHSNPSPRKVGRPRLKPVVTFATSVSPTSIPKQSTEEQLPVSSIMKANPFLSSLLASDTNCKSSFTAKFNGIPSLSNQPINSSSNVPTIKPLTVQVSADLVNSQTDTPTTSTPFCQSTLLRAVPAVSTIAVPSVFQYVPVKTEPVESTEITVPPLDVKCNVSWANYLNRTAVETIQLPKFETSSQNIQQVGFQPGSLPGVNCFVQSVNVNNHSSQSNQTEIEHKYVDSSLVFNRISPVLSTVEPVSVDFPTLGNSPTIEMSCTINEDAVDESQHQTAIISNNALHVNSFSKPASPLNVQKETTVSQPAVSQLNNVINTTVQKRPSRRVFSQKKNRKWTTVRSLHSSVCYRVADVPVSPPQPSKLPINDAITATGNTVTAPLSNSSSLVSDRMRLPVVKKCSPTFLNMSGLPQHSRLASGLIGTNVNQVNNQRTNLALVSAMDSFKEQSTVIPSVIATKDQIVPGVKVNQPMQTKCVIPLEPIADRRLQVSYVVANVPPSNSGLPAKQLGAINVSVPQSVLQQCVSTVNDYQTLSAVSNSTPTSTAGFYNNLSNSPLILNVSEQTAESLRNLSGVVSGSSELTKVFSNVSNENLTATLSPCSNVAMEERTIMVKMPTLIEKVIASQLQTDTFSDVYSDKKLNAVAGGDLKETLNVSNGKSKVGKSKQKRTNKVLKETDNKTTDKNMTLFKCEICSSVLKSKTSLKRHTANHLRPKDKEKTMKCIKVATVKIGNHLNYGAKSTAELKDETNNCLADSSTVCHATLTPSSANCDAAKEVKLETVDFKKMEIDLIMGKQLKSCSVQLVRQKVPQITVAETNGDPGDEIVNYFVDNENPVKVRENLTTNSQDEAEFNNGFVNNFNDFVNIVTAAEGLNSVQDEEQTLKEKSRIETEVETDHAKVNVENISNDDYDLESGSDTMLTMEMEARDEPVIPNLGNVSVSVLCVTESKSLAESAQLIADTRPQSEVKVKGRSSSRTVKPPKKRCCDECKGSTSLPTPLSPKKCKIDLPSTAKNAAKINRRSRGGSCASLPTRVGASGAKS
ncbi:hypothetical protein CHUAL_007081 [Chamberlinius hualienensis]